MPDQKYVQFIDLSGHWTNHDVYAAAVGKKTLELNKMALQLSDTQLVLDVKNIQNWARSGLENGLFKTDPSTFRLL